ncbi:MBL fold metallo-hydrolase [Patescibacteria group bacterium]|nr:MBL fold metallo-hydrolase [Patescibacteria group bacterium]
MKEIEILKKPLFWLVLLLILVWTALFSLPDQRLHLIFCDVGQGDAILISYQKTQILIDGGPDNRVLNCLSHHLPFWDRRLEVVVLTHPEKDHFGGLVDVIKRYSLKYLISYSWPETEQKTILKAGDEVKLGKVKLSVLWPKEINQGGELNENSLVLKLTFGSFCALLPGDISSKTEDQLDKVGPCQVLKVAHHGSRYSTGEEFLEKVRPVLAVISVGPNSFGHPTEEVIKKLKDLDIKILRTDQDGEIEIVSNGENWYIKSPKGLAL